MCWSVEPGGWLERISEKKTMNVARSGVIADEIDPGGHPGPWPVMPTTPASGGATIASIASDATPVGSGSQPASTRTAASPHVSALVLIVSPPRVIHAAAAPRT